MKQWPKFSHWLHQADREGQKENTYDLILKTIFWQFLWGTKVCGEKSVSHKWVSTKKKTNGFYNQENGDTKFILSYYKLGKRHDYNFLENFNNFIGTFYKF